MSTETTEAEARRLRAARLEGLNYALNIAQGRRVLNRPPAYLACVEEMEIFLKAAIERVETGEDMSSVAICQGADRKASSSDELRRVEHQQHFLKP